MMGKMHFEKAVNEKGNHTWLNNTVLRDPRLSWKAIGIHCYLMHLPSDWDLHVNDLVHRAKDGMASLLQGLGELEKYGYFKKSQTKSPDGKFSSVTYTVFEKPQLEGLEEIEPEMNAESLSDSALGKTTACPVCRKEFQTEAGYCPECHLSVDAILNDDKAEIDVASGFRNLNEKQKMEYEKAYEEKRSEKGVLALTGEESLEVMKNLGFL